MGKHLRCHVFTALRSGTAPQVAPVLYGRALAPQRLHRSLEQDEELCASLYGRAFAPPRLHRRSGSTPQIRNCAPACMGEHLRHYVTYDCHQRSQEYINNHRAKHLNNGSDTLLLRSLHRIRSSLRRRFHLSLPSSLGHHRPGYQAQLHPAQRVQAQVRLMHYRMLVYIE